MPRSSSSNTRKRSSTVKRTSYKPARLRPHHEIEDIEHKKRVNSMLYWSGMLLLTILNFLAALVMIPFLLSAAIIPVLLMTGLIGLFFGYVFHLLIDQLEHLHHEHKLFAVVFIPLMAVIGVLSVISSLTTIAQTLGLPLPPNPYLLSGLYLAAFILPTALSYWYTPTQKAA